jgi:hypothetical protein
MPTKPQSGAVRVDPQPIQAPQPPTPPLESTILHGVGTFMLSSLPPMASGADVYARQFYRGTKVPFRRYLPVKPQ